MLEYDAHCVGVLRQIDHARHVVAVRVGELDILGVTVEQSVERLVAPSRRSPLGRLARETACEILFSRGTRAAHEREGLALRQSAPRDQIVTPGRDVHLHGVPLARESLSRFCLGRDERPVAVEHEQRDGLYLRGESVDVQHVLFVSETDMVTHRTIAFVIVNGGIA